MSIFPYLALGAILLLLLFETVEIEYIYDDNLMLKIRFSVLEITLWSFSEKNKSKKRPLKKRLRAIPYYKKAFDHTLYRSDITINRVIAWGEGEGSFDTQASVCGAYSASLSLLIAYLEARAKTVKAKENTLSFDTAANGSGFFLSATQSLKLIHLLSGLLIIPLAYVKKLTKERLKIGR